MVKYLATRTILIGILSLSANSFANERELISNGDFESGYHGFFANDSANLSILNTGESVHPPLRGNSSLIVDLPPYYEVSYLHDPNWGSGEFYQVISSKALVKNVSDVLADIELCSNVYFQNGTLVSSCDNAKLSPNEIVNFEAVSDIEPNVEVDRVWFRIESKHDVGTVKLLVDEVSMVVTPPTTGNSQPPVNVALPEIPSSFDTLLDSSFEANLNGFTSTSRDSTFEIIKPGLDNNGSLRADLPSYHRIFFSYDFPWNSNTFSDSAKAHIYAKQLSSDYTGYLEMCLFIVFQNGDFSRNCLDSTDSLTVSGELLEVAIDDGTQSPIEVDRIYFSIQNIGNERAQLYLDSAYVGLHTVLANEGPVDSSPAIPPAAPPSDPHDPDENLATDLEWTKNISPSHPRLLFTQDNMNELRDWHSKNPFEPGNILIPGYSGFDPSGNAFKYLLTGESRYADIAIEGMYRAAEEIYSELNLKTCNTCRWYGEETILSFDWLYDYMSAEQRNYIASRLTPTFEKFLDTYWGSALPIFDENNFFWGYFRNAVLWGIAIYGDDEKADMFLQRSLAERWENIGIPHFNIGSPSGIPSEGVNYGPYLLYYKNSVQKTLKMYGRDLHTETNWYRNSAWWLLYSTLPKKTFDNPNSEAAGWTVFPYGDAGGFYSGNAQLNYGLQRFLSYALTEWDGSGLEGYLRNITERNSSASEIPNYIKAFDNGGDVSQLNQLPTDYFIDGELAYAYTKSSWDEDAAVVNLQLTSPNPVGHEHLDSGNWQFWKDGVWASRESPARGYGSLNGQIPGYLEQERVNVNLPIAHNVLLVNGEGPQYQYEPRGSVTDVTSEDDYFYASVDLSDAYSDKVVDNVKRSFLFIKPIESLLILDNVVKRDPDAAMTFIAHFQSHPQISHDSYSAVNRHIETKITTLLPTEGVSTRVVNEEREIRVDGQPFDNAHRLMVESKSSQFLLHAVVAKSVSEKELTFDLVEGNSNYLVKVLAGEDLVAEISIDKDSMNFSKIGINKLGEELVDIPKGIEKMSLDNDSITWNNVYK
ncbi:hypothetical protein [Aliiglaciecola sp. M165]|uniref:hypothetical protein n=1 Tax=Aliiglaciecola sp. M165 TaxID=2593649 RepID=UPI00117F5AFE|nr:hypothetical protein [Aliiglaciecola sp. M165]TRY31405.1 hypothetical protein FM019_11055 [Aliiglaciecola sp. M165]